MYKARSDILKTFRYFEITIETLLLISTMHIEIIEKCPKVIKRVRKIKKIAANKYEVKEDLQSMKLQHVLET